MLHRLLAAFIVMIVLVGGLWAAEGVIVSFDKNVLKVKVGDKEKEYKIDKKTHIHDSDDSEIKGKDRAKKLKKGVKVEIEEEDGKVKEIKIKK